MSHCACKRRSGTDKHTFIEIDQHKRSSHQKKLNVLRIRDNQSPVSVWHEMSSLLVATISNLWANWTTLESSPYSRIDTLWLSPAASGKSIISVGVMSDELLCSLFDDGNLGSRHLDL